MPKVNQKFKEAAIRVLEEKSWSFRRACIETGIPHSTIGGMASGLVPGMGHVINWAIALREPINDWLELAGYPPIPAELVS